MPNDLRAVALSSQSIQVTWKAPHYTLSDVAGYKLIIVGKGIKETVVVANDVFSHTFLRLNPSTEYIVSVQVGLYSSIRGPYPYCGGTLIAPDWIITAAHCVERAMDCIAPRVGLSFSYEALTNATLFARIGDHDLVKTEASERDRVVQSIVVHPNFKLQSGNSEHDIALLRLEKSVVAEKEVDFICLPMLKSTVPLSQECTFAGWGSLVHLSTAEYINSPVLMEGRLTLEPEEFCQSAGGVPRPLVGETVALVSTALMLRDNGSSMESSTKEAFFVQAAMPPAQRYFLILSGSSKRLRPRTSPEKDNIAI
ncbi:unnamed protein product [Dibothriocephalus latus]|uniref:Fibronectin type-III domain-containing protein n=1 Tax=Dibothriocephalus latus TaxID=60516 RepID=A0A3P7KY94_DIBLA|nr:unnamed protein product [Dibothriocephalus latus]